MKSLFLIFGFLTALPLLSQDSGKVRQLIGSVSYVSSQNVYVRFDNTEAISEGDTLFFKEKEAFLPGIIVKYISTTSCAGEPVAEREFSMGDEIIAFIEVEDVPDEEIRGEENVPVNDKIIREIQEEKTKHNNAELQGRVSISSYSNFSNSDRYNDYQRWRYVFSMRGSAIDETFSDFDSYIAFSYRNNNWNEVTENISEALRIYSLAGKITISDYSSLWLGRKINRRTANIGAVDGAQLQMKFPEWHTGLIIGSRPNFTDYNYNLKLFQFGAYGGRTDSLGAGYMENTIGAFEQTNNFNTDRRLLYFQHNNTSIENITLFASAEIDLFKKEYGEAKNTFSLTSLYLNTRFSPSRLISFSLSYDARKNVIYYETFKSIADSVLEDATRQGFRFRVNLRPANLLYFGVTYGYRYRDGDRKPTNNAGIFITYSRVPFAEVSAGLSYNYVSTSYVEGGIAGLRLTRDIISGILSGSLSYRNVQYKFSNNVPAMTQDLVNLDLTGRIMQSLFLSLSFELTYQDALSQKRIYLTLNRRF